MPIKVVVKNPLWPYRHLMAGPIRQFETHVGERVDPPAFVEPGTICLTTGHTHFPVRELHPSMIVAVNDVEVTPATHTQTRVVKVAGSKGNSYSVTIGPDGRTCTCTGFAFRRSCRHIAEA